MYTVTLNNRERKFIDRLPTNLRQQIYEAIQQLSNNPRPTGCMKLTNAKDTWRIRVGHYRIGYQINDGRKTVDVVMAAHRNEFYPKGATH